MILPPATGDIICWVQDELKIYFLVLKIDSNISAPYHCQNLLAGTVERFERGCFNNVNWRMVA